MIEIKTGHKVWDNYWPLVESIVSKNRIEIEKDGSIIPGFHAPDDPSMWFRDNIHMMYTSVFMYDDIQKTIDFMLKTQMDDGSYYDFLALDGRMLRVPTEADLEYLAVIGVYRSWLATGDDEWLKSCLPILEHGLDYMTSHPWRWDSEHQMPKRAYTIDTWDFDARDDLEEIHWPGKIDDKTHFGIMHGDVGGLCYAWHLMVEIYDYFNDRDTGDKFRALKKELIDRANKLLWNGRFYRHRYPLDDFRIEGVNEEKQMSLSNAYNLNRHFMTPEMARSVIQEYMKKKDEGKAFAEWYSIDPPFPVGAFGTKKLKPGCYVNGGIMPLVGGELARGAFRYGFNDYAVDILQQYYDMISPNGEAYLWYQPDGSPATPETSTSPETRPYDGWGSSAMMGALLQGLAGVRTEHPGFQAAWIEPKWYAAGVDYADVTLQYAPSGKTCHYVYEHDDKTKMTTLTISGDSLKYLHIGFPDNVESADAEIDCEKTDVKIEKWQLGRGTVFNKEPISKLIVKYKTT